MQRETRQRKLVMDILMESKDHPDALSVFRKAEEKSIKISLGTVYRTLELLVREGKAIRFYDDNAVARYDAKVEPHHHLICKTCGKVEDLEEPLIDYEKLKEKIEDKTSFSNVSYQLIIYGVCEECRRRGHQEI
ncbi:MAG TPA: transcriptional repressor [Dictyoglomaceae bacterium]|nr:transcriptional repressor [Dictyoglomaceae bacterium]HOL38746.1 transcriptional repressor [Dictyoglomaceae bacterium]HOP94550.1 transcriptional repressor [Dictyoglomaceae bacterium]HPP15505.1 transcriptional repressor [Dictyoglomaceae bacterium]HPU43086.1 transcriptional repressor [Dictyoglomaceae bacterium]